MDHRHRLLLVAVVTCSAAALLHGTPSQTPAVIPAPQGTHTENGLAGFAKILCSGVFVSERAPEDVARGSAYFFMPREQQGDVKWTVDRDAKRASTATRAASSRIQPAPD
jgi:hypothetical protein